MPEKDGLPLALCGLYILRPLVTPGWGLLWGRVVVVWKLLKALLVSQVWPGVRVGGRRAAGSFPRPLLLELVWTWTGDGHGAGW